MGQSRSRPRVFNFTQTGTSTAVNKELNFSVKKKPQTIDYKMKHIESKEYNVALKTHARYESKQNETRMKL